MKKLLCVLLSVEVALILLAGCVDTTTYDGAGSTTAPEITTGTTAPDFTEETTVPDVTEPEVTEPEVTEPEVTEPEVTEPEVTEPEVTEPEVTEPEVTEPEVTEPEVTEPEYIVPEGAYVPRHDGVTLKIGIPENADVLDYVDNAYTKWLQEETGITIQFVPYCSNRNDYLRQLAVESATNDIQADILIGFDMGADLYEAFGNDGYFLDLSAYLQDAQRSNIFWSRLASINETETCDPWLMERLEHSLYMQNAKGKTVAYALPAMTYSSNTIVPYMPFINAEWLDALHLDIPTNLQELTQVLMAFRDQDPNGNGQRDEIPMLGCKPGTDAGDAVAWLINFFVHCNNETWFNIENGQLYLPHTTDAYREALKYIHNLVESGLLHPNTFTYKAASLKTVLSNADMLGVVVGDPGQIFANSTIANRYVPLNLYGNTYFKETPFQFSTFITEECQNVDAAWDLLMVMYTQEGAFRQFYGPEGENWEYADNNTMTPFGMPATIKVLKDIKGVPTSDRWYVESTSFFSMDVTEAVIAVPDPYHDAIQAHAAAQYINNKAAYEKMVQYTGPSRQLPALLFIEQEEWDMADCCAPVQNKIKKWTNEFLTGIKNIHDDAAWDAYLAELDALRVRAYLRVAQKCYDRLYPNGHLNQ